MSFSFSLLTALSLGIYPQASHLGVTSEELLSCGGLHSKYQCRIINEALRKGPPFFAYSNPGNKTLIGQVFDPARILSPLLPSSESETLDPTRILSPLLPTDKSDSVEARPSNQEPTATESQPDTQTGKDGGGMSNPVLLNNGRVSESEDNNKSFLNNPPTKFRSPGPPSRPSPKPPQVEPPKYNSPNPYVILVNGYQDQAIWVHPKKSPNSFVPYIGIVTNYLASLGSDFMVVPWDHFEDGGGQKSRKVLGINCGKTLTCGNDAEFLRDGANYINNKVPLNRPLVLIGHSFGGDSLLKLSSRINRNIAFLGVIDSTTILGMRTRRPVPSNVHYFFNRWQENPLRVTGNIVPFDNRITDGRLQCGTNATPAGLPGNNFIPMPRSTTCDQDPQNISRNSKGEPYKDACKFYEVTCSGYKVYFWGIDYGTKQRRIEHDSMPKDEFIQTQMLGAIKKALSTFPKP